MKGKRPWRRVALSIVVAAILAGSAISILPSSVEATTVVAPRSMQELVDFSDHAVHCKVLSIDSYREGGQIFTQIEVSVIESLKGDLSSSTVSLEMYGGTYNGISTIVIGAPSIRLDEEMVVFLKEKRPDVYYVINLAEGKFSVVRSEGDLPRVERDLSRIHFLETETQPEIPETLEALKAAIAAAGR